MWNLDWMLDLPTPLKIIFILAGMAVLLGGIFLGSEEKKKGDK